MENHRNTIGKTKKHDREPLENHRKTIRKPYKTHSENNKKIKSNEKYVKSNFMEALFEAYSAASKYSGLTVSILLEAGNHFILPSDVFSYQRKQIENPNVDFTNPDFRLTVRPLYCGDQIAYAFDEEKKQTNYKTSSSNFCSVEPAQILKPKDIEKMLIKHTKI